MRAGGVRAPGASFISPGGRTPGGNMDIVACADRALQVLARRSPTGSRVETTVEERFVIRLD